MKMNRIFNVIIGITLFTGTLTAEVYRICDMWTGLPLDSVQVIIDRDSLTLRKDGLLRMKGKPTILVQRTGYFPIRVDLSGFSGKIIFLEPISSTEPIVVVREAASGQRPVLPAHITRLRLDQNREHGFGHLASALSQESGIFIKSYGGAGQLQTIALRGMSAEQTQVLLDGVPVNNLQLGSVDLGQFDLYSIAEAEIYRGGSALFGGSGSIGGTVNLRTTAPEKSFGYRLNGSLASFGNREFGLALQIPLAGVRQSISFLNQSGVNNYSVSSEGQSVPLQNRDFSRQIMQYRTEYAVNADFRFGALLHAIKSEGGSPKAFLGAAGEEANRARLSGDQTLLQVYTHWQGRSGQISARAFLRNEWMEYRDPLLNIGGASLHSRHFNRESGFILRGRYPVHPRLLINGGLETSRQEIQSSEAGRHTRRRTAGFVLADWQIYHNPDASSEVHLNASLRTEAYSDFPVLLLPGIGAGYRIGVFNAYLSLGSNYRAPSFNDLYWQPGGNPHLLPERSIFGEVGLSYENLLADVVYLRLQAAYYTNRVTNLIKWLPVGQVWTPQNIGQVLSRGIEADARLATPDDRYILQVKYTRGSSRKNKADFEGDRTVGNQLPYLPDEQVNLSLQTNHGLFSAGVNGWYSSFRYTTLLNNPQSILPSVSVWRIWLSFDTVLYRQKLTLLFHIDNLFDQSYQIISGYPMPPRQYGIRLELALDK
ncbi:MAG TPA: TonB-dependent receptor [Caldithrix abyssi]|uniref:TonB-dependent receptor n=1 Tax=Caldithrix abyssi TaxID=187145 RepID=A0A7V4U0A1_CALAY|nr:TonB-dependent receptor [Caldithrix abyssi]